MFESRQQAGEMLATELKDRGYGRADAIVLAIPRGGVPVGRVVADNLQLPFDIIITRKIPASNQPELALGAVGPEGQKVFDIDLIRRTGATQEYLVKRIEDLTGEINEREKRFRFGRRSSALEELIKEKIVILVDDGIATGATVEVAIRFIKTKNPARIILATPVASRDSVETLKPLVDDVVVLSIPEEFYSVGEFYKDFKQVTDEEVINLLKK